MKILSILPVIVFILFRGSGNAQDTTRILLQKADVWEYSQAIGPDVQRIIGNVILSHDSTILNCDSAYLDEEHNHVTAFGNVHLRISDTLNLYGDSLKYDGNSKIARVKSNVRLVDNETVLTTDTLSYNRTTKVAMYDCWGKIVNAKNVLVSKFGYYYTDVKHFFFKEKVILTNPEYWMRSDTLMYNTVNETAYFFGPTELVSKDRLDSMYCERGWYDTRYDIGCFTKSGIIFHEYQVLSGDSLYYERMTGFGKMYRNATIVDTVKNTIIRGDNGELRRKERFAFMTERAEAVLIENKDSLFLHSDTLRATIDTGQNIRDIFSYYAVRFFRSDLQGVCDSLAYHGSDSSMVMYRDPVIWSGKNQLTADSIRLTILNGMADSLVLYNSAFIAQKDDSGKFNQVKGRDMVGFFSNNEIYKVKVLGNSESIYWLREDDGSLIGINKVISSDMLIFLKGNEVSTITYMQMPSGSLNPEKEMAPQDLTLRGFRWVEERRPLSREDIFRR